MTSTLWLIDKKEVVGVVRVRHEEIGLDEVIVTCNISNIASKKVIEKNNGKLLGTVFEEEENEYLYKYSIPLSNN